MAVPEVCFKYIWVVSVKGVIAGYFLALTIVILYELTRYVTEQRKKKKK